MATLMNVVVFLLVLVVAANSQGDVTSFTYDSFSKSDSKLIFQGDTSVLESSSYARLTKADSSGRPARNSIGRLVYAPLVNFWAEGKQASFETTIKFLITNPGNSPNPGDTISFFIAPPNIPIPPGSQDGNLGLVDPSTGLAASLFAVEFDIAPNPWDPKYSHIGININSRTSRNVSRFDNAVGQVVTARINYVSNTRTITVVATYGSQTSSVSYVIDLKTVLPQQVQVGISGTTGSWVAFFDLHSWYFTSSLIWDGAKNCIRQYI